MLSLSRRRLTRRLGVEPLEGRLVPAGYTDNFEAPMIAPLWSLVQNSGTVSLSTAQAHSGQQSVQFTSTSNTGQKGVYLLHDLGKAAYGRTSVWVYDNAADVPSSNYLTLTVGRRGATTNGNLSTQDYDLGPGWGDTYLFSAFGGGQGASTVDRTQGWHRFVIDSSPDRLTLSVDGIDVYSGPGGGADRRLPLRHLRPDVASGVDHILR